MIWLYKKDKIQNWSKKVLARPVTYIIDKGIEEWRAQRWIKKVFYKMTYKKLTKGRGGGQMVSVLAFNSDDPSSNPAESTVFSVKLFEKDENTRKGGREYPILKTHQMWRCVKVNGGKSINKPTQA